MEATESKTEVLKFIETFNPEVEFLSKYTECYGLDICNIFEMINNCSCQAVIEIEKLNTCKVIPVNKKSIDKAVNNMYHVSTLVQILKERIDSEFFFHLSNMIYTLDKKII